MSKFIELGQRYGLEPWQLGIEYDSSTSETYITGIPSGREASQRFMKMIEALGVPPESDIRTIPHQDGQDMMTALDQAIENVPRKWVR